MNIAFFELTCNGCFLKLFGGFLVLQISHIDQFFLSNCILLFQLLISRGISSGTDILFFDKDTLSNAGLQVGT